MSIEELDMLFNLKQQLIRQTATLEHFRTVATSASPQPISPDDVAVEIVDVEREVSELEASVEKELPKIMAFIAQVPEQRIRSILRLRFVRGMTWKNVASALGGKNTEFGVRMACHRFIASISNPSADLGPVMGGR